MHALLKLMRIDKPVGIWLLMWPTWQTAFFLSKNPNYKILVLLTVGVIISRSTGCIINDLCDIKFDQKVSRTKNRPLAAKIIKPKTAFYLASIGMILCLLIVLQLPIVCLALGIIAGILMIIYPLSKRWFFCPQLFLGIAFAMPVLITTFAFGYNFINIPWLLFFSSVIWTIAYDTLYAMADKADDLKLDIHSSAKWLGHNDFKAVVSLYIIWIICWLGISYYLMSFVLLLFISITSLIMGYYLKKAQTPAACFNAFKINQYLGGILLLGIVLSNY